MALESYAPSPRTLLTLTLSLALLTSLFSLLPSLTFSDETSMDTTCFVLMSTAQWIFRELCN